MTVNLALTKMPLDYFSAVVLALKGLMELDFGKNAVL